MRVLKAKTPTETEENIVQEEYEKKRKKSQVTSEDDEMESDAENPSKGGNESNSHPQMLFVYIHFDHAVYFMEESCVTCI
jgi:hypothetical protein